MNCPAPPSAKPFRRIPGIVIANGQRLAPLPSEPRIAAFIWGGKVRPAPTLPYGRWRGAA